MLAASENVARRGRGYAVAATGLVLGLTLLLCGVAISEGIKAEALLSVRSGADVYCTWDRFGRDAPVPADRLEALAGIPGVVRAVPRVLGRVTLGGQLPVVIGVPLAELARHPPEIVGRLPSSEAEVLIGHELARATGFGVGTTITLEGHSIRLFEISGVVSSTSSLWSASAVVCDLPEARLVFGEEEHYSDICLYTRPGYAGLVAEAVERLDRRFRVQTKELVEAYVFRGMTLREGIFTVLAALALALAIPSFAICTYLGHTPRRREIGLLKAEGWSTADLLEMVALENVLVSLLAAGTSLLAALVLVQGLRAPLVASFFLAELPAFPAMRIPSSFAPLPAILAFVFSLVVTMSGSIYSTWRTATARPAEVLR